MKEKDTEFLRSSGIVYNALMTKRFKHSSDLDVSKFDIESWIKGISHFQPTWRNLLMIVRNMGYHKRAERIEKYLASLPHEIPQVPPENGDDPGMRMGFSR